MLHTAKIRCFIIPLLICATEGRKAQSPVNVSEVHLESVVAEVCFSSPSWLDGPGTESALLMEVEGEVHNGRKSLILAPQEIPDISGQGGIKCGNRGTGFLDSEGSHR